MQLMPVFEKPKNFFDICIRENLNIRFCLAFSQSWFSNHKMYFSFSLLNIPFESDTTIKDQLFVCQIQASCTKS